MQNRNANETLLRNKDIAFYASFDRLLSLLLCLESLTYTSLFSFDIEKKVQRLNDPEVPVPKSEVIKCQHRRDM